ncbi:site-specific integrase [Oscillatoria laete-virens NRMC-F 0139]|nr:site-specific integrase [Oscillatoria laete-virens]MDL5055258.1 site-specific integrase [Oscillatoria laete-virens NRMC-F 0139]
MKSVENHGNTQDNTVEQSHAANFTQVRDSRNRKVPGLWIRNGKYYACLWVDRGDGRKTSRRFPLEASGLAEAKEQMEIKRGERREDKLPTSGRKPLFSAYIDSYLKSPVKMSRRENTQEKDRRALHKWLAHIGNIQIHKITRAHIVGYQDKRLAEGVSPRTVNLDLISLRGLLKRAVDEGHIRDMPMMKEVKRHPVPKRELITPTQLEKLINQIAVDCPKTGGQVIDYLRLLAYCGAREQEALRLKWDDIDFRGRRIHIGKDGLTKNREARTVEFNPQLEDHLKDMFSRRAPDSVYLFPSIQRGRTDTRTKTFRNTIRDIRGKVGLPKFGFHDLRHYFASMCVMNGIDFMTIAAWLGHKDGGILVGKVYGHLLSEHRHQAAQKLQIGFSVIGKVS